METSELIRLSVRALIQNKLRSFLTTLGIIIGVFAIIMLVSIGTGLQRYITNQISSLGDNIIDVIPGSSGNPLSGIFSGTLRLQDAKNIQRKIQNIAKTTPIFQQTVTLKYKNVKDKNAFAAGVSYQYPEVVSSLKMFQGRFFTKNHQQSGSNVVVIGYKVYKLYFDKTNAIGKKIYVGEKLFTIVGVVAKTGVTIGVDRDNIVYIPIELAQAQFGTTIVREIVVSANSKELTPIVINQIKSVLSKRLSPDDFSVETADTISETISNVTNALSLALGGIAAISLLVGGIGVANIMLVSVTERTREIGLRKALGAKRSDILKQFLLEAIILSLSGGTIGILLGLGGSIILSYFLVSDVSLWSIILAFTFSIMIGIIFGMAPAIRASKLNPIDALRYE